MHLVCTLLILFSLRRIGQEEFRLLNLKRLGSSRNAKDELGDVIHTSLKRRVRNKIFRFLFNQLHEDSAHAGRGLRWFIFACFKAQLRENVLRMSILVSTVTIWIMTTFRKERKKSAKISFLGPETARRGGGLLREGVVV